VHRFALSVHFFSDVQNGPDVSEELIAKALAGAGENFEGQQQNAHAGCACPVAEVLPIMLPIPGTSSIEHLEGNLKAA
jgi:hypothetical protein